MLINSGEEKPRVSLLFPWTDLSVIQLALPLFLFLSYIKYPKFILLITAFKIMKKKTVLFMCKKHFRLTP